MKTSTFHWAAAMAMMTTASVSFAQPYPGAFGSPSYGGTPDSAIRADTVDRPGTYYLGDMNRNCAGLSDRQTERACKQGYPVDHRGWSIAPDPGGKTDDQAD
jgi:hypothetical protein